MNDALQGIRLEMLTAQAALDLAILIEEEDDGADGPGTDPGN